MNVQRQGKREVCAYVRARVHCAFPLDSCIHTYVCVQSRYKVDNLSTVQKEKCPQFAISSLVSTAE